MYIHQVLFLFDHEYVINQGLMLFMMNILIISVFFYDYDYLLMFLVNYGYGYYVGFMEYGVGLVIHNIFFICFGYCYYDHLDSYEVHSLYKYMYSRQKN
jgi:hypothetical protein